MDIYIASVIMGIALAATTRLKMTLPFLILGIAIKLNWGMVHPTVGTEWLGSWPALICFGVAVVLEIVADNIPAVEHGLDVAEGFISPVAGAFIVIATSGMAKFDPLMTLVLGLIGAGVGAGAYLAHNIPKRGAREISGGSFTGASFLSSISETGLGAAEAFIAVNWPWIALGLAVLSLVAGWLLFILLKKRPGLISILVGLISLCGLVPALLPFLGILAWFTLAWSFIGLVVAARARSWAGAILNFLALLLSLVRVIVGLGVF
ncbi:MAG: DUF4126 domain-containing protein [candidate division WOR-3 bacterium]